MMPVQRVLLVCLVLTRVSHGQDPTSFVPTFSAAPSVTPAPYTNNTLDPILGVSQAPNTTLTPGATIAPGTPTDGTDVTPAPAPVAGTTTTSAPTVSGSQLPPPVAVAASLTPTLSAFVTLAPTTAAPTTALPTIVVSEPPLSLAPVSPGIPLTGRDFCFAVSNIIVWEDSIVYRLKNTHVYLFYCLIVSLPPSFLEH
jgi:hypothetical protein